MTDPLVTVDSLQTYFDTDEGMVKAVSDVSLAIPRGRTLGLVGESGCGKSVTAMSIMRLIAPPGRIAGGRIWLHGGTARRSTWPRLAEPAMRQIRGGSVSMIFQEPMTSLNPVFTVGAQIVEADPSCTSRSAAARPGSGPSRCSQKVRIPEPAAADPASIRTSSPAACGSG